MMLRIFSRNLVLALALGALAACAKQDTPPVANPREAAAAKAAPASPGAKPQDEPRHSPSSAGGAAKPPEEKTPAAAATPELLKQGEELFTNTCATCHMADGYGVPNLQPQIVGSGWISSADPQPLLSLILRGSAILGEASKAYENDMAPQDHLSDAEIAALATYVRGRFGAPPVTKPVTPAEVAIARARPGLPQ
jgi:mono/diheme cytochrome c family protein